MRAWNTITACGYIINPDFKQVETQTKGTLARMTWSMAFPDQRDPKNNDKTTWVTCTAWGSSAEVIEKYCTEQGEEGKLVAKKGAAVGVVGTLIVDKYTDREGVVRKTTKINVERIHLMGSNQESSDGDTPPAERSTARTRQPVAAAAASKASFDPDKLPF